MAAYTKIQTLSGDGSSGVLDFTSIAGTFNHLRVVVVARSDAVATSDDMYVRFNNDSGANYDWEYLRANNGTASVAQTLADTNGVYLFGTCAATSTASYGGTKVIDFPFYAGTTFFKQAQCQGFTLTAQSATGLNTFSVAGTWRNTAAITRVTLRFASGKFITGSSAILYGIT